ncbi:PREDICTED: D-tyrosyl-tRNA(Tyr) deacylase-like [Rhagoletis zephyria]|uniref:D-tyrosyl-tRNA(Tyr) deacylase-like n=1 Tax=Rhagoletis zephyria TaxID=28612 RepID=UPI0008117837|nr:PREDICTED: D-tyrosyl-tRNA(Tyr) deacylase-like [Rhagoletis zephyria]
MRAVIQRVTSASVTVDEKVISQIGQGLCVLIGISRDDTEADSDWICNKILKLTLFDNTETGKRWSSSVTSRDFEVLCISQFTLFATLKGNKPDFHLAMEPVASKALYQGLLKKLRSQYSPDRIHDGQFGAYMKIKIENDGPVTVNIESPNITPKVNKRDCKLNQPCPEDSNKTD